MNPFQFPVTCTVCGGEGMGTAETAGASWFADTEIHHSDPRVCASNLRKKKRDLERREEALKEKLQKMESMLKEMQC